MNDKKRLGQRYITSRPGHSITAYGDILLEAVENLLEGERARGQGTLCPELWTKLKLKGTIMDALLGDKTIKDIVVRVEHQNNPRSKFAPNQ